MEIFNTLTEIENYSQYKTSDELKNAIKINEGLINGATFTQLRIPKRPNINYKDIDKLSKIQKEKILNDDNESFLEWRKELSSLENLRQKEYKALLETSKNFLKNELVKMTPYETNIDIWRQLWICVDTAELLCIILDARNPLFFKNDDLEN